MLVIKVSVYQPWVNFTNILQAAFKHKDPQSTKESKVISVSLRFWDLPAQKLCVKCW